MLFFFFAMLICCEQIFWSLLCLQKHAVKAPVSSSQIQKNKDLPYKSISKNKATSCKPHTTDAETQIGINQLWDSDYSLFLAALF